MNSRIAIALVAAGALGQPVVTPEELTRLMQSEISRRGAPVKKSGAQAN